MKMEWVMKKCRYNSNSKTEKECEQKPVKNLARKEFFKH